MSLVLASASPRRAALLEAAGFSFVVLPAEVDETPRAGEPAVDYVLRLAIEKARAIAGRGPAAWPSPTRAGAEPTVLGADTTVVVDDEILGKPDDRDHAVEMLRKLSGRTHEVLTGVALARGATLSSGVDRTRVTFAPMTGDEIAWYADSGEPLGKAGGYAIQGLASRFVDRIDGSYTNVVGLPMSLVYRLWRELSASTTRG